MVVIWRKRELSDIVYGNVNWCSHCGKQYEVSQKTKIRTAMWTEIPTPGCITPQKITLMNLKRCMYHNVYRLLFTIAKLWKQLKCPPIDEWQRSSSIYMMEYYSVITEWHCVICNNMDGLGCIMLSETRAERQILRMIPLICRT